MSEEAWCTSTRTHAHAPTPIPPSLLLQLACAYLALTSRPAVRPSKLHFQQATRSVALHRSLIRAALLLEGCDARGVAGGRSTCEATADGACTWRSFGRSDAASPIWPLLSQLLRSTSTTATSSSDERCVPASLETVIQPYLDMTAPEACYDIADVPTCFAAAPRCFYEDHDSHGHCMPVGAIP